MKHSTKKQSVEKKSMNTNLSDDKIIDELLLGKIKSRQLDELGLKRATEIRRKYIEKATKKNLSEVAKYTIDVDNARKNIELMVGAVQVPLGIAGPVQINGDYAKGNYYLPLATTEGALLASVNRGCSIIRKCGGAKAYIFRTGQTRSVLFNTKTISTTKKLAEWIKKNEEKLKNIAKGESKFLELTKLDVVVAGNNLWIRLEADTKDAMGMNMITFAAERVGDYVEKNFPEVELNIEFVSASGNLCIDKKPSAINLVKGRGKTVLAEVTIPNILIKKYLKTTATKICDLNYRKNILGSMIAGSYGFNAHFANIISAMFIATGQDTAHVVEGSQGYTTMEINGDNLLVSVTIPSVQVGTVGGGTNLEAQKECLGLLGVDGSAKSPGDNAMKLAEIVGVAVLAGELSLIGALAARQLGKAHMELGR